MLKCLRFLFAQSSHAFGWSGRNRLFLPFYHSVMLSCKIPRAFQLQQCGKVEPILNTRNGTKKKWLHTNFAIFMYIRFLILWSGTHVLSSGCRIDCQTKILFRLPQVTIKKEKTKSILVISIYHFTFEHLACITDVFQKTHEWKYLSKLGRWKSVAGEPCAQTKQ